MLGKLSRHNWNMVLWLLTCLVTRTVPDSNDLPLNGERFRGDKRHGSIVNRWGPFCVWVKSNFTPG